MSQDPPLHVDHAGPVTPRREPGGAGQPSCAQPDTPPAWAPRSAPGRGGLRGARAGGGRRPARRRSPDLPAAPDQSSASRSPARPICACRRAWRAWISTPAPSFSRRSSPRAASRGKDPPAAGVRTQRHHPRRFYSSSRQRRAAAITSCSNWKAGPVAAGNAAAGWGDIQAGTGLGASPGQIDRRRQGLFDMLGVFAGFETNLRRERQMEGPQARHRSRPDAKAAGGRSRPPACRFLPGAGQRGGR